MNPIDVGMTVKEVAAVLKIPEGTVYLLCQSGRLPHRRMGTTRRQIRITQKHIERYLASCEVDETNAPGIKEVVVPPVRRQARPVKQDPSLGLDGLPMKFFK